MRRSAPESGASLVEYVLLLALIVVVAVGSLMFLGSSVTNQTNGVGNHFSPTTMVAGNGGNGNGGNGNGNGNNGQNSGSGSGGGDQGFGTGNGH